MPRWLYGAGVRRRRNIAHFAGSRIQYLLAALGIIHLGLIGQAAEALSGVGPKWAS